MADTQIPYVAPDGSAAIENAAQLLGRLLFDLGDARLTLIQALLDRPTQEDVARALADLQVTGVDLTPIQEALLERPTLAEVRDDLSSVIPNTAVTSRGSTRSIVEYVGVGMYDVTDDIYKARTKSTYNGDDAPAINKATREQVAVQIQPIGLNTKTPILAPLSNAKFVGLGGGQSVVISRDHSHTGSTLVFGSPDGSGPGAGSVHSEGLWFVHPGRLGYTGGALDGLLTNNQSHIEVHGGQKPRIRNGGYGAVHFISYFGCSGIEQAGSFVYGGVNNPDREDAQEAISHVRFAYSDHWKFNKTIHLIGAYEYYGNRLPESPVTVGDKVINIQRSCGPLYNFLCESYEDLISEGGFSANARLACFGFIPQPNSYICANAQIRGGHHDEAGFANILIRRYSDDAPMVDGLLIDGLSLNGQFIGRHAIYADGSSGRFACRDLHIVNCRASAFHGSAFALTGVDGGSALNNRIRGYNTSGSSNSDAILNSGIYIDRLTRNFHCDGNVYGGGPNGGDPEENHCRWGRSDLTPMDGPVSRQNNTFGASERLAYLGSRGGFAALGQAGGALGIGGQALQQSLPVWSGDGDAPVPPGYLYRLGPGGPVVVAQ